MSSIAGDSHWNEYNQWNRRDLALGEVWNRKIADWLMTHGLASATASILDYGCSNFDLGLKLIGKVRRIDGFDPNVDAIAIAKRRLPAQTNTALFTVRSEIPEHSYDVVVINSVLQYFDGLDAVGEFLRFAKDHLLSSTNAKIVIGDLIPKKYSAGLDALNSLAVAARYRVFRAMFFHLAKSALKPGELELLQIDADEMREVAAKNGFECEVLAENLTLSPSRYSVVLSPSTR